MGQTIIYAPYNGRDEQGRLKTYLSDLEEFNNGLPFGILNKGMTGCGGTTLEYRAERHSIICVPSVQMVQNKESQWNQERENVIGVYKYVTSKHVMNYLEKENEYYKIITTYDSLWKVLKAIENKRINVYERFFLLVDEYHSLFYYYRFRNSAIKGVLNHLGEFAANQNICFLSATPLKPEFLLTELRELPKTDIIWQGRTKQRVNVVKCHFRKVKAAIAEEVIEKLKKPNLPNLHIFVNSVSAIDMIVSHINKKHESGNVPVSLSADNCKAVYSIHNKTLRAQRIEFLRPEPYNHIPKHINFYTLTAFEGTDIYDPNGRTLIYSDSDNENTLEDVNSRLTQIIGRIRDCTLPADEQVFHFYSISTKKGLSFSEFKTTKDKLKNKAINIVNTFNEFGNAPLITHLLSLETLNKEYLTEVYDDEGKLITIKFDENLYNLDVYNYWLNRVYQSELYLMNEYEKSDFITKPMAYEITEKIKTGAKLSFKDKYLAYAKLMDKFNEEEARKEFTNANDNVYDFGKPDNIKKYEKDEPLLYHAYTKLGSEIVKALGYNRRRVQERIIIMDNQSKYIRVYKLLKAKGVQVGNFVSSEGLKAMFKDIYDNCGIVATPKGSDIKRFFESESRLKWVDGKPIKGFLIKSPLIIFKD